jgi:hypothetical protein
MKFKKIVGFGDSWIWGDELLDPTLVDHEYAHPVLMENTSYREEHCFLGLLGKHYNVPTENFGIPGGSLQSSIWTYLWWLENEKIDPKDCLVLVGLTEANRETFYNPNHVSYGNDPEWNRFVHSIWVRCGATNISKEWANMIKTHMVLTSCTELQNLNYRQAVMFFEGQYNSLAHNVVQFNTIHPPLTTVASSLVWPKCGLRSIVDYNPLLMAPNGHPNEAGHRLIRDHLIPEIESVILA